MILELEETKEFFHNALGKSFNLTRIREKNKQKINELVDSYANKMAGPDSRQVAGAGNVFAFMCYRSDLCDDVSKLIRQKIKGEDEDE